METRDNSGVLFRNDKGGNEKRPDYTGNAVVNGKQMKLSAWVRTSANGNKYLSVAFTASEAQSGEAQSAPSQAAKSAPKNDNPDDLPFTSPPG